ncbi:MAG: holdfast anchoring protein HfaB [Parvibaculaceae bacterium]|nr:holdfast anchoring protein HfaB [Parvibaculaceae bacterium]
MFSTTAKHLIQQKSLQKAAVLVGLGLALTGCISPTAGSDGRYTTPIGSAPVINNETPYSSALRCIGSRMSGSAATPRIAVGNIKDYTGKVELEGGAKLTQGASLMAISGLSKAGVMLVERFDTSVAELELKYANDRLIGDANPDEQYRQIYAGSIRGSDYYMVGGITELNFDIRSGGINAGFSDLDPTGISAAINGRLFVMNVGLDLRLVDSRTLEVVHVVSYQKQIIGREISAGVFDFLNGNTFEIGAGERANEPLQLGVRSVIERAILEMIVPLYGVQPADCRNFSNGQDPLGEINYRNPHRNAPRVNAPVEASAPAAPAAAQVAQNATQNATPAPTQTVAARTTAAPVMNDPYGYYSEPIFSGTLRGGYN